MPGREATVGPIPRPTPALSVEEQFFRTVAEIGQDLAAQGFSMADESNRVIIEAAQLLPQVQEKGCGVVQDWLDRNQPEKYVGSGLHIIAQYVVLGDVLERNDVQQNLHVGIDVPAAVADADDMSAEEALISAFVTTTQHNEEARRVAVERWHRVHNATATMLPEHFGQLARVFIAHKIGDILDNELMSCFGRVLADSLSTGSRSKTDVLEACSDSKHVLVLQRLAEAIRAPHRLAVPLLDTTTLRQIITAKTRARQAEYQAILQWNLCHPAVKGVHLLLERPEHGEILESLELHAKDKIRYESVNRRLFYSDAIGYADRVLQGEVVAVVNSDIFLGQTFDYLDAEKMHGVAYVLSRHESFDTNEHDPWAPLVCCSSRYDGCHDAVVFRSPTPAILVRLADFQQNRWGAENALIVALNTAGLHISNPCHTLKIFHYHLSDFRPRQGRERMHGVSHGTCPPSKDLGPGARCFIEPNVVAEERVIAAKADMPQPDADVVVLALVAVFGLYCFLRCGSRGRPQAAEGTN